MSNPEVADHKQLEPTLIENKNRNVFKADVAEMLLTLDFFLKRKEGAHSGYMTAQLRADEAVPDGVWSQFILDWNIPQGVSDHLEEVRRSDALLRDCVFSRLDDCSNINIRQVTMDRRYGAKIFFDPFRIPGCENVLKFTNVVLFHVQVFSRTFKNMKPVLRSFSIDDDGQIMKLCTYRDEKLAWSLPAFLTLAKQFRQVFEIAEGKTEAALRPDCTT